MKIFVFIWFTVCFLQTYQQHLLPKEGLCFVSLFAIGSSALPAYFYEMMDDFDEINSKYEIVHTTYSNTRFRPTTTTTTTEKPIIDEWKKRGEFRIMCVDEVRVDPKKIVRLMSQGDWKVEDELIKQWVLCVLNKMEIMSKEGVFKMDVALNKIDKKDREEAESLIDHCLPTKHMIPRDIAWRYVKCHSQANGNFSAISVF